ncbi:hypothetical protein ACHAXT_010646 [Thalassiosira profunda]
MKRMSIVISLLIVALAWAHRIERRPQRWRHPVHPAFVHSRQLASKNICTGDAPPIAAPPHHIAVFATASQSGDGDNVAASKPKPTSPPKGKRRRKEASVDATIEANATAASTKTKTVEVTRIKSKKKIPDRNATSVAGDTYSDSTFINGLVPDTSFDLLCRTHCTLTLLRKHLPSLLELPALSPSTAQWIYDLNVTITGPRGEELAVGREEVLLLNRALATAATAARRAGSLLDLATGASSTGQGQVECEIMVDTEDQLKALVLWRTRLPSIGVPSSTDAQSTATYTEFSGKSTFLLDPATGLVADLQVDEVKINGVPILEPLGTALAAIRRAARSAMATTSLFGEADGGKRSSGNPFVEGLLSGIQDFVDAVDALPSEDENDGTADAPLFVVPGDLWDAAAYPVEQGVVVNTTADSVDGNASVHVDSNSSDQQSAFVPEPIDRYLSSGQIPLAGSKTFVEYASLHQSIRNFAKYGLHQLAGTDADGGISSDEIRSLFATDAELTTSGQSGQLETDEMMTLLRGAGKIADLYRSLALFRESSGGDWKVASLDTEMDLRQLIVRWRTELPLSSDGSIEEVATRCSSYFGDGSGNATPLRIERIDNLQLKVAGVTADSAWAQQLVSAALRSGITENAPLPDATIAELLRSLTSPKKGATKKSPAKEDAKTDTAMPALDDSAAASFYGILRTLHLDLPNIASPGSSSSIPANDYLSDNIELRGLLEEVLVRGSKNYRRLLGVVLSSLNAAIQTNAVRLAAKPRPTVEVTAKGSIKVNFVLALWVTPNLPLSGALGQSKDNSNQGFGVPLKIEVTSEYVVDNAGRIREHRILESRLNGVLTPGDVFSKWIKGLTRGEEDKSKATAPSAIDSLVDAIAWVKSMQGPK